MEAATSTPLKVAHGCLAGTFYCIQKLQIHTMIPYYITMKTCITLMHGLMSTATFFIVGISFYHFQGSSAFVCGWVLFADRVSNGVLNKIALQLKPSK